ncbi:hypothetical protein [Bdellovibrio sp. HCB337]|uniref:hypothetical protein n=1 Tax=Bdellovibrio sp. HCB337 TaxID=3394358 RepID=UPI0039A757DE
MKKLFILLTGLLFAASLAHGEDMEKKETTSVDTSTNPITGTKTTTKKTKKKSGGGKDESKMEMTETVKEKSDGTVKKSVEVEQKSEETKKK